MAGDATVVLVHGAWADGSSWSKVITGLHAKHIDAVAVPMPLTSFEDDVNAVQRVVEKVGGPVILVGHAYGGAPMAAVASPMVKALVYVAALAPDEGETVAEVFGRDTPHASAPKLAPDAHGVMWLPTESFGKAFAQNASADEQAVLAAVQRPISPQCIMTPVGRPSWKDVPAYYLLAEHDHMIPASTQRFMAERMKATIHAHPFDHTPSVTAPAAVVDVICEALERVSA
ncbi:Signal peptide protein [Pararobbsia alpina]|uniref:alpha/beta fold hydrolase n=1 Tax=Pararobbsia alpina TaxID=621374 RepID=UPI0039A72D20